MAITVREKPNSERGREGDRPQRRIEYVIRGTRNTSSALSALRSAAPLSVLGLRRLSEEVNPVSVQGQIPVENCVWEGIAQYGLRKREQDTNDELFRFNTTGATQRINQSIETINSYLSDLADSGEEAPDFEGAIGVTKDGIEGVDLVSPQFSFSVTKYKPIEEVTHSYVEALFELTGTTNNAAFGEYERGEVLFLGADGSRRGLDDYEITFNFEAIPNKTDLEIGSITGIEKKGWEYLWIRYEEKVVNYVMMGETREMIVQEPLAVYIEQVYEEGNFGALDITPDAGFVAVTFDEQNNLSGVSISVAGAVVTTDSAGEAVIHLSKGTYSFKATKDGYVDYEDSFVVAYTDKTVEFTMVAEV